jgi:thiamine pyrophosphate-dependent acetolactate synthase large subunit-like protein
MNKLPAPEKAAADNTAAIERPLPSRPGGKLFGSDVIAQTLRDLDIPYIALNPGASYRGLHDSLVNYLGNERPQMLLCPHEENAVAIAQGYAKVTGRPMLAAVHSNVGLMHASMAIFNAWCDRMPVLILGATGPMDAAKRRPWIEWIHTARDQGALVRGFSKWDDQPSSPAAAREALLRGAWIAQTAPRGPVYINFDAEMQEAPLEAPLPPLDAARYMPPVTEAVPAEAVRAAAATLKAAKRPVLVIGRTSRRLDAWNARVALAEGLKARVVTDLKNGAGFPTDHPLHVGPASIQVPLGTPAEAIRGADVILSLDPIDLAGWLGSVFGAQAPQAKIIQVSTDYRIHNGWSMDYQALPPVDLLLSADPEAVVPALLEALGIDLKAHKFAAVKAAPVPQMPQRAGEITMDQLSLALRQAAGARPVTLTSLSLSWNAATWPFNHPLDYIGGNGGGGVGGGPGISVGAALALKGSGRLPIGVCGDGDFLMGLTSVWTAVHYRIPLLFIVANNRSFFNDEVHQQRVAHMRERPEENRWIGMRMSDPDFDFTQLARGQGALGFGPVLRPEDLRSSFETAIKAVEQGAVAVVDVRIKAAKETPPPPPPRGRA